MPRHADIVMEGGGAKGVALVGALAVFEAAGYSYINLAGTSAGAIVASLAAAGYPADELRTIIGNLDLTQFMDSSPRWLPPKTRGAYNLLAHWGIYKGDRFLEWMRTMLAARGVGTFKDLKRSIPDRRQLYRLRVVASDVTRGRMIVLPGDARAYGIDPDELDVALAVRMSMSIPGFFRPVVLHIRNEEFIPGMGVVATRTPCYIVDGGLLSNFPIALFDGPGMDARPTFGIRLTNHGRPAVDQHRVHGLVSYVMAMFGTAMGASDAYYLEAHDFIRTIEIDNLGISATAFDLSATRKSDLFDAGAAAAREFLATWDFAEWQRVYRDWAGTSRRKLIIAAISGDTTDARMEHQAAGSGPAAPAAGGGGLPGLGPDQPHDPHDQEAGPQT